MNTTEIIFYFVVIYTIVFFINRLLYFKIQEVDEDMYPNPGAVFFCFLFLLGTLILILVYITSSKKDFFKFKKK
jgi:NADH:ubiquinone oxidoreductase subunit 6 (subunit J)